MTISLIRDESGAIRNYLALFSDITRQKTYEQELEHVAHYDALTGLPNRVLLTDRLQQAMYQARRRNLMIAIVYLDLDGFKAINDTVITSYSIHYTKLYDSVWGSIWWMRY